MHKVFITTTQRDSTLVTRQMLETPWKKLAEAYCKFLQFLFPFNYVFVEYAS